MAETEDESAATRGRRLGRRPGPTTSRSDVLAAASRLFATEGYTATTIRAIGDAAKVDPALVVRLFGGKEHLFAAVMHDLEAQLLKMQSVLLDPDGTSRERRLAAAYFSVWESPTSGDAARALVRGAVGAPRATEIIRERLERQLLSATMQPGMGLAMATLFGIAISRYILQVGPLAKMPTDELIDLAANQIKIS